MNCSSGSTFGCTHAHDAGVICHIQTGKNACCGVTVLHVCYQLRSCLDTSSYQPSTCHTLAASATDSHTCGIVNLEYNNASKYTDFSVFLLILEAGLPKMRL